ncbi:inositol monophosphatase [Candidatus Uhrbacteria bacterium]|nr:inositol monophosphatase [Candidatus Uhrbacteria bacterium]
MQQTVEKIIRGGGDMLLRHFGKTTKGNDKKFKGDTESDADRETEQYLVTALHHAFPDDAIITEEHPKFAEPKNGRLWIVDALDGSRNFIKGIPFFGISIALAEGERVIFGMVYLPLQQELFWAARGSGAFLNGKRIAVKHEEELENTVIPFLPHYYRSDEQHVMHISQRMIANKIWQFNPGFLVVPLCYTACGRFDGMITLGVSVWDVAGGNIIAEEAGATVTDESGKPWSWRNDRQNIVAANPVLHKKIMREIIGT